MQDYVPTGIFVAIATAIVFGIATVVLFSFRKKGKLSKKNVSFFLGQIEAVSKKTPSERIVAYDKILDHMLARLNYRGTLGEKLKRKPALLSGRYDDVWYFHKIRNRLVHDLENIGNGIEGDADGYEKLLRQLLLR